MEEEDTARLVADVYLQRLLGRNTNLKRFWSGVKISCIGLSLILSFYCLVLVTRTKKEINDESRQIFDLHKESDTVFQWYLDRLPILQHQLSEIRMLPIVDCYRNKKLMKRSVVTYNGCFVDTSNGSMNIQTGVFNTTVSGIYQISFTAKYVASNQGKYGAWSDIYINDKVIVDSQREYNGPNVVGESETSTHTVMVLHLLDVGDMVKVKFHKDGSSYMHSDSDHDVHFTIRMISPPPSALTTESNLSLT